jgi:hypothetical protein
MARALTPSDDPDDYPPATPTQFTMGKPFVECPANYEKYSLPLGPPTGRSHCYSELEGTSFQVRGKRYMSDGVKVDAKPAVMSLRHVEFFRHPTKLDLVAEKEGSFLQLARAAGDSREYLIIVYQTPGRSKVHLVLYFCAEPGALDERAPPHLRTVWERFCAPGNDEYRRARWKVIPRIAEGAWLVQSTVGTKPALLGTKIPHKWYFGEGYVEADCDVTSSTVATMIVSVIEGSAKHVVIDLGFAIEGREEEELPEVVLGAVRLSRMDLSKMGCLRDGGFGGWVHGEDPKDEGGEITSKASSGSWFW